MADFIEIGTDDPKVAKAFYTELFDWTWESMGKEGQGFFTDGDRQVGMHVEETPCVVPYLLVDDIEAMAQKVTELGGSLFGEIADAPGFGRFATCADPSGARFGLHQKD